MAARNNNFSTQFQSFMTETYVKERDAQLAWHFKVKRGEMGEEKKPRQFEVFKRKIEEGCKPSEALLEKLPKIATESKYNRKKKDPFEALMKAHTSVDFRSEMRPSTPKTKYQLYDGFTKEGKGRYQYLRSRYLTIPEDKYEFPLLSSWEYGWRLSDVIKKEELKKPQFGRTRIVVDTFYTRNGTDTRDNALRF